MAKPIITTSLKKRLQHAAFNGSIVASDILEELEKDTTECFGERKCNYFNTRKYTNTHTCDDYRGDIEYEWHTVDVNISYCNKDLDNEHFPDKGNPRAPYIQQYRTYTSCGNFISMFVNLTGMYSSEEIQYFDSAMRLPCNVNLRIGSTMDDFLHAYEYVNYSVMAQHHESTLHNSCMRHTSNAECASDFYANFLQNKILIAEDDCGNVLGRAILWDSVYFDELDMNLGLIERTYACFDFIHTLMKNYAAENGYSVCKMYNDYCHQTEFKLIREIDDDWNIGMVFESSASVVLDAPLWNKDGYAYMDTMSYLYFNENIEKFVLANTSGYYGDDCYLASFRSSSGINRDYHICPVCGHCTDLSNSTRYKMFCLCGECYNRDIGNRTIPIPHLAGECITVDGITYPKALFTNDDDCNVVKTKTFLAFEALDRLYGLSR